MKKISKIDYQKVKKLEFTCNRELPDRTENLDFSGFIENEGWFSRFIENEIWEIKELYDNNNHRAYITSTF